MATNRRRHTTTYSTYGSVAYAPAYEDGSAVRLPRREEELQHVPVTQPRRPVRRQERTRVRVRQAGQIAPFAVIGFLAAAVFAILLVTSCAQLAVVNDEMVTLRQELDDLKSENTRLSAQYERVFDLSTIQAAVGDTMIRPTTEQVVYIDLSEPDTVTVYQSSGGGLGSLIRGIGDLFAGVIEYFR